MHNNKLSGHFIQHGKPVIFIALMSGAGILSSFVFQLTTARFLGPSEFGTLAAVLAYINIAATGSSSLQSSVAVETAASYRPNKLDEVKLINKLFDGPMIEAIVLGVAGSLIILAIGQFAPESLMKEPFFGFATCASIILSFVLARSIGGIQGTGRSVNAVWWTTFSLLLRLFLVGICFVFHLGLIGVLWAVVLGSLFSTIGATYYEQKIDKIHISKVFSKNTLVVICITIVFSIATNADVIFVRARTEEYVAGTYAAAAVLIKSSFMVPATLSIYLLPRYAKYKQDVTLTRVATRFTLILTLCISLMMLLIFGFFGTQISHLLYGEQYDFSGGLLIWLVLAYLPWTLSQVLLIQLTAKVSLPSLIWLVILTLVEVLLTIFALPKISGMLWTIGCIGLLVFVTFSVITKRLNSRTFEMLKELPS